MFDDFSKLVETAHTYGIPVIAWVYPRGRFVQDELSTEIIAYSARIGLELGADFVKINYNNDFEGFKWVVKAAGKAKVLVAGSKKLSDKEVLQRTYDIMKAGVCGLAVGRNVWQHEKPLEMTKALKKIIFDNKSVNEALKILK
jgi:class I fructose-bisphosphate aldolase